MHETDNGRRGQEPEESPQPRGDEFRIGLQLSHAVLRGCPRPHARQSIVPRLPERG